MISVIICQSHSECFVFILAFFFGLYSDRSGGAHGRYGTGDWTFLQCREYMTSVCSYVVKLLFLYFLFLDRHLTGTIYCRKRIRGGHFSKSVTTSGIFFIFFHCSNVPICNAKCRHEK